VFMAFAHSDSFKKAKLLNGGLINSTFLIEGQKAKYVLQQINSVVFKKPILVIENGVRISNMIRAGNKADFSTTCVAFIPTLNSQWHFEFQGAFWRLMHFVKGQTNYFLANEEMAFQTGLTFGAYGRFLSVLEPASLHITIPDFHNLNHYLGELELARSMAQKTRLEQAYEYLTEIEKQKEEMQAIDQMARFDLPVRVVHHDSKVANLLFDSEEKLICILDLDTTMPGTVLSDFGDLIRTGAVKAAEDEQKIEKIQVDESMIFALRKGYVEGWHGMLSKMEIDNLMSGSYWMVYMQAVRFLTDYLNGDTYYSTQYSDQNLRRTRVQLKILEKLKKGSL